MPSRTVRTLKKDGNFFEALATGVPIQAALNISGYKRRTVYDWRRDDESFRQQWEDAVAQAVEALEAEADRRGVEGTLKPVFYQGEECGQIREYSDTLLIFRLKALAPSKYRENIKQEVDLNAPIQWTFVIGEGYVDNDDLEAEKAWKEERRKVKGQTSPVVNGRTAGQLPPAVGAE